MNPPSASSSESYLQAIERVDQAVEQCRNQVLTTTDFRREVVDVMLEYLRDEDPRDDVSELVDYIVEWADELSSLEMFADRVLVETVEQHLRWCLDRSELDVHLGRLLSEVRDDLTAQFPDTTRLIELCTKGIETHELLFSPVGAGTKVIELAYEFEVVEALDAAIRPSNPNGLAAPYRDHGKTFTIALDALAHIASNPREQPGRNARQSLVELAGFVELGAWAALRLPVHLLDAEQRAELLRSYARRQELVTDKTLLPNDESTLRELEVIRTAVWQTTDAQSLAANPPN